MRKGIVLLLSVLGVASAISCSGGGAGTSSASPTASGNGGSAGTPAGRPTASSGGATPQPGVTPATMAMTSSAFAAGGGIPAKYTCDGQGVSPPLQWDAPPSGTQSLALIVTDPDAPGGTYVHWVIYGLPGVVALPAGERIDRREAADGRRQWAERCGEAGLYAALPAERDPPLLLPSLRAGHEYRRDARPDRGRAHAVDERPHRRASGVDGDVRSRGVERRKVFDVDNRPH